MKATRKQIEANLRNKLAAQYREKSDKLAERVETLERKLNDMHKRAVTAENEKEKLEEKVAALEDWNNRLLECMDMTDEDRKAYVETLRAQSELKSAVDQLYSVKLINHFLGYLV
jgi:BMFP domain-containing protein YqiC